MLWNTWSGNYRPEYWMNPVESQTDFPEKVWYLQLPIFSCIFLLFLEIVDIEMEFWELADKTYFHKVLKFCIL